jgi:hypothetical protein
MSKSDDKPGYENQQSVVKFPWSRTRPKTNQPETRDLGVSKLTQ